MRNFEMVAGLAPAPDGSFAFNHSTTPPFVARGRDAPPAPRLAALDGLRGIAAFSVVYIHYASKTGMGSLLPSGDLAVDFFFILSGYVLGHVYGGRLAQPGFTGTFLRQRVLRLYPLAITGLVIGVVVDMLYNGSFSLRDAASAAIGFTMLPSPLNAGGGAYPYNPPLWSLFCEMVVNVLLALAFVRLSNRVLLALVTGSTIAYFACYIYLDQPAQIGRDPFSLLGVSLRTTGSFFLGVLLQRANAAGAPLPRGGPLFVLLSCALLVVFALPRGGLVGASVSSLATVLIFPAVIIAGARLHFSAPVISWLGKISFPLYVLHEPLLTLFHHLGMLNAFTLASVVLFAWLVSEKIDGPLHAALKRWSSRYWPARPAPA